jgi:hypothetical protein
MIQQMLSHEPLKEFKRVLAAHATETTANSSHSLHSIANQIFPTNAYAKQEK